VCSRCAAQNRYRLVTLACAIVDSAHIQRIK
jgi:hypothetical protein